MNNKKQIILTQKGLDELQAELKELKDKKLPKAIKRVATARELGDLRENAEYHAAREDHAWIQGRIEELEAIVQNARVVEDNETDADAVGIGKTVKVQVNGHEQEFHIVGEWEANPMEKKISHESPLGKALVGKKVGEKVEVEAPAGKVVYTVIELR